MKYNRYQTAWLTRSLWMGMAVFFVVFCSCPVKKYFRMQLYRHSALATNTTGDHYSRTEVKDCTIAEREDQTQINFICFLHGACSDHDFIVPLQWLVQQSPNAFAVLQKKFVPIPPPDAPPALSLPLYLRMRRIQV
jgi:hypothetical protein